MSNGGGVSNPKAHNANDPTRFVRCCVKMNGLLRGKSALLPWLFPLALLLVVLAVAFAPNAVTGGAGIVVFLALGYGGVALYYRRHQQRSDHDDVAR
jgi:hypothetical protein